MQTQSQVVSQSKVFVPATAKTGKFLVVIPQQAKATGPVKVISKAALRQGEAACKACKVGFFPKDRKHTECTKCFKNAQAIVVRDRRLVAEAKARKEKALKAITDKKMLEEGMKAAFLEMTSGAKLNDPFQAEPASPFRSSVIDEILLMREEILVTRLETGAVQLTDARTGVMATIMPSENREVKKAKGAKTAANRAARAAEQKSWASPKGQKGNKGRQG